MSNTIHIHKHEDEGGSWAHAKHADTARWLTIHCGGLEVSYFFDSDDEVLQFAEMILTAAVKYREHTGVEIADAVIEKYVRLGGQPR